MIRSRLARIRIELALVVLGVGIFATLVAVLWRFTIDDAFISFRYAAHLAAGDGLRWNADGGPTEGYTSFLWVVALAGLRFLGMDLVLAAKLLGISCVFGILLVLWWLAGEVGQDRTRQWRTFAIGSLLFLGQPATAIHAVAGMETLLYSFGLLAVAWLGFRLTRQPAQRERWLTPVVCLIVSLTRPEAVLVTVALYAYLTVTSRDRRALLRPFVVLYALPATAYLIFRLAYFGRWLPLPVLVKSVTNASFGDATQFVWAVAYLAPFVTLIGWGWTWRGLNRSNARPLIIIGTLIAACANVGYLHSALWANYALRFFYPTFLLAWTAAAFFIAMIAAGRPPLGRRGGLAATAVTLALLLLGGTFASNLGWYRHYAAQMPRAHRALGEALAQLDGPGLAMATEEAGALAYYAGWHHVDMVGLNDPFIADRGAADLSYVEGAAPSVIIIGSTDGVEPNAERWAAPFLQYAVDHRFTRLPSVYFSHYLIVYVDPAAAFHDQLSAAVSEISERARGPRG